MIKKEFESLQLGMQDYIRFGYEIGIINKENIDRIYSRLLKTKIIQFDKDEGFGGFTYLDENDNIIKILMSKKCIDRESNSLNRSFEEYYDENLFHELTHAVGITPQEIDLELNKLIPKEKRNERFYYMDYGYSLIDEVIAQSISQRMVTKKYGTLYPFERKKFVFNKNSEYNKSFSYEYNSNLQWYGEIEQIALDFVETLYEKRNINLIFKDHFNGTVFEKMKNVFENKKDGLDSLYKLLGNLGNILCCDYYQQGYPIENPQYLSVSLFENSIKNCKNILSKSPSLDD